MSGLAQPKPDMIADAEGLDALCRAVDKIGWFAFDTEFVGEDQYSPEVCLIQVASEGIDALIDPLVPVDTTPLWERNRRREHPGDSSCRRRGHRPMLEPAGQTPSEHI